MVEDAVMDIFNSLGDVRGRDAALEEFMKVLRTLFDEGLNVDDDMLYDDEPTPRPRKTSSSHIPEAVAVAGSGPTGRVGIAKSLWRRCVPRGLQAIYWAGVCQAQPGLHRHRDPRTYSVCFS